MPGPGPTLPPIPNLLQNLGENPVLSGRFRENPEKVMDEFGLTDEHKILIRNADKDAIARALADDPSLDPAAAVYVLPVPIIY